MIDLRGASLVGHPCVGLLTRILAVCPGRHAYGIRLLECPVLASNLTHMLPQATRHVHPGGVFRMSAPMKELAKMWLLRWWGGKAV